MNRKYCKDGCEFINYESETEVSCVMYNKPLKVRGNRIKRIKKCNQESHQWDVTIHIEEMRRCYDEFICEMDIMFDELDILLNNENENE